MILLKPITKRHPNSVRKTCHRPRRIVTYPPPSTGTNYNLVNKVEHDPGDRVIWHIINPPADGSFVYDYDLIQSDRQEGLRMCLDCRRVKLRGLKRLCDTCARSRKRASNRKSQSKRRSNVRKTRFSPIGAEALTNALQTARYTDPARSDSTASIYEDSRNER